ncbi:MAG TPA: penicillin-binding protein 1A [Syntrophobacteria bacterium]|nr:penicillin-binding protein 1A [Syntrophobacteria bacterium]
MNPKRIRNLKVLLIAVLVLVAGSVCGAALGVFLALTRDLPSIRELESFRPSAATRLLSVEGKVIGEFFVEKRLPITLAEIPPYLKQAVIAIEDQNFYKHAGIDWQGIMRAGVKDLMAGRIVEGGSTITQQLAKLLFLDSERTMRRKWKEALLALQIERRYRKDEILTLYLNQIYLGSGTYGVEAAANVYFGKHVWELDLAECALIAGLSRAPSVYSPLVNPEKAMARRALVLKRLREADAITEDQYRLALDKPLGLAPPAGSGAGTLYFADYLRPQLEEELGANLLYRGGLTVQTTLRDNWQRIAEQALANGLTALEQRHRGKEEGDARPQGGVVILDVATGLIRAMVGGRDYATSQFNRAFQAERQPGSAFKPIVYAYALERGYSPSDRIYDGPVSYPQADGTRWEPKNYSGKFEGDMTLRHALEVSQNVIAIKLLERVGPNPVVEFAHKLGITSRLQPNLSLALGTSEVNLLELVSAYQVFAHGGIWVEPSGIVDVLDANGRSLWRHTPGSSLVCSEQTASTLTDMLTGVIQRGTGKAASRLPWPLAGKTGTTESFRDAWFVGFSPSVVAGVWVGYDNGQELGPRETGAQAALPIWTEVMEKVLPETPQGEFKKPESPAAARLEPGNGRGRAPSASGNGGQAVSQRGKVPQPASPAPGAGQKEVAR